LSPGSIQCCGAGGATGQCSSAGRAARGTVVACINASGCISGEVFSRSTVQALAGEVGGVSGVAGHTARHTYFAGVGGGIPVHVGATAGGAGGAAGAGSTVGSTADTCVTGGAVVFAGLAGGTSCSTATG